MNITQVELIDQRKTYHTRVERGIHLRIVMDYQKTPETGQQQRADSR